MVLEVAGKGLIAAVVYLIPAISIWGLASSLGATNRDGRWEAPPEALALKAPYQFGARWAARINRILLGLFLVRLLSSGTIAREGCDPSISHLAAAAWNIVQAVDPIFTVGFAALALLNLGGLAWAIRYAIHARRAGWKDPKTRDHIVVHAVLVPLALLLLFVGFGIVDKMFCG